MEGEALTRRDDLLDVLRSAAYTSGVVMSTSELDTALRNAKGDVSAAILALGLQPKADTHHAPAISLSAPAQSSSASEPGPTLPSAPASPHEFSATESNEDTERDCQLCLSSPVATRFRPCGHAIGCELCTLKVCCSPSPTPSQPHLTQPRNRTRLSHAIASDSATQSHPTQPRC
jgi:hypothetical protein